MGILLAWTQLCKRSFPVRPLFPRLPHADWLIFLQLSHLFCLCSLNGDNGMIGSLTRSWVTTIRILPLQVLAMPWSVKNVSLTMGLSKRVCGKMLVSCSNFAISWRLIVDFALKEYVCPKCNHFNASTRSKRLLQQQTTSPNASATSSPSAPVSLTTQPQPSPTQESLSHSPQESDLPNVDRMEVDSEVDASIWGVQFWLILLWHLPHRITSIL